MNQPFFISLMALALMLFSSCHAQEQAGPTKDFTGLPAPTVSVPAQYASFVGFNFQKMIRPDLQIGAYVRRVFEDHAGNLWFGTNGEGVGRFDGRELSYFSTYNGLSGRQVTAIMEDSDKNIWIATDGGVSRMETRKKGASCMGITITNFTESDGLGDNRAWSLHEDKNGTIWAGTEKGVSRFDGTGFTTFPLPAATAGQSASHPFATRVCAITEDSSGKLWFGTDGGGAFAFDGSTFAHFTTADGLCDNQIVCMVQDRKGNLWFGSMNGGLGRYDGKTFRVFNQQDGIIGNNEVWNIYEDHKGNIWCSAEGFGVYRFDGETFTRFGEKEGLNIKAVQTIYEDSKGRLWIGGGGGLYRFDGKDSFFNVTRDGLTDGC